MKLALGTAQFGMAYGVANVSGKISRIDALSILNSLRLADVDTIDTAIEYGDSEACLGQIGTDGFKIVTKLPAVPEGCDNVERWVLQQVQSSMTRLGVSRLYGLLLHRPQQLSECSGKYIVNALNSLKASGFVEKIGVSIYSPIELEAITRACSIDLIQAPMSLLDRRLVTSGWLSKLKASGVEIHVRSVFLQGLLLMSLSDIPPKFSPWKHLWARWHDWLDENATITPAQACLGYVCRFPEVDRVVVGVDSLTQFSELLEATQFSQDVQYPDLDCVDQRLLNPSSWGRL